MSDERDDNGQVVMRSISDALGMAPLVVTAASTQEDSTSLVPIEEPGLSQIDADAEEDFALARKNFKEILEKGSETLESMLRIAQASEHPRAFEVAANLIKTMTDANQNLLKLHEQRRQLVPVPEADKKSETTNITNNNVFVGTTQELLDMLDAREQEARVIDHDSSTK